MHAMYHADAVHVDARPDECCQNVDNGKYCRLGGEAEKQKGEPKLGVKKKPWWPFIPVTHYMVPLLHCEIGIGNQLLDTLRDTIMRIWKIWHVPKKECESRYLF